MKVIINADGRTCTTVNPLGDKPELKNYRSDERFTFRDEGRKYIRDIKKWQKAQDERQTFEIDFSLSNRSKRVFVNGFYRYDPGTTHSAEIVNGKAVIK